MIPPRRSSGPLLAAVVAIAALSDSAQALQQASFESDLYTRGQRAKADEDFVLVLGLQMADFESLESRFWDVSDPRYAHDL